MAGVAGAVAAAVDVADDGSEDEMKFSVGGLGNLNKSRKSSADAD